MTVSFTVLAAKAQTLKADYDGDGKTDVAVFRNDIWSILQSVNGFAAVSFGRSGDAPIPNAFVP